MHYQAYLELHILQQLLVLLNFLQCSLKPHITRTTLLLYLPPAQNEWEVGC